MQQSIVFLVRVQCCLKESLRSLSHLLMSFLFIICICFIINCSSSCKGASGLLHIMVSDGDFYCFKGVTMSPVHYVINREVILQ